MPRSCRPAAPAPAPAGRPRARGGCSTSAPAAPHPLPRAPHPCRPAAAPPGRCRAQERSDSARQASMCCCFRIDCNSSAQAAQPQELNLLRALCAKHGRLSMCTNATHPDSRPAVGAMRVRAHTAHSTVSGQNAHLSTSRSASGACAGLNVTRSGVSPNPSELPRCRRAAPVELTAGSPTQWLSMLSMLYGIA